MSASQRREIADRVCNKQFKDWDIKVEQLKKLATNSWEHDIYIVNAGRMNHGKSSLFNALAEREDLFAVADCPMTIKCENVSLGQGLVLIDTPGIDARDADTVEAYRAYTRSDYILFVHNINTGELHEDELTAINKICSLFPTAEDFWKRFCLVITRSDAKSEESIKSIVTKAQQDIASICKGNSFPVFVTSASRYWRGIKNSENTFIEKSGISKLKEYLISNANFLKISKAKLNSERFKKQKKEDLIQLNKLKAQHTEIINKAEQEHSQKVNQLNKELIAIQNSAQKLWNNCNRLKGEINLL